jgi:endonuclease G, mitochondrial
MGYKFPKLRVTPQANARLLSPEDLEYSKTLTAKRPLEPEPETTPLLCDEEWKELVESLYVHRRRLLRIPGVTGVDIGYKIKNGAFTNEVALRVHVERKLPPGAFDGSPADLIPKDDILPENLPLEQRYFKPSGGRVPMDVIEAKYKPTQVSQFARELPQEKEKVNRRRRLDPLVGGISIGSPLIPVGTLGALVWDKVDGSVCILSNWHVLAGSLQAEPGTPCFQPGRFDQGRSSDVVAHLKRWSFNRQTDAAIAELNGSRHYSAGEIVSMFQQITGEAAPHLGMIVLKSSRSSGFTPGFVDGLYFSAPIEYSNGLVRVFEEQIHIAPLDPNQRISEPGDSGGVWVTETPSDGYKAVGLHFAGDLPNSSFGEYALANPMTIVAERLQFSFRPLFLEIRDPEVVQAVAPAAQQPAQAPTRNGTQPFRIVVDGLTGSGSQPEDERLGPPPPGGG